MLDEIVRFVATTLLWMVVSGTVAAATISSKKFDQKKYDQCNSELTAVQAKLAELVSRAASASASGQEHHALMKELDETATRRKRLLRQVASMQEAAKQQQQHEYAMLPQRLAELKKTQGTLGTRFNNYRIRISNIENQIRTTPPKQQSSLFRRLRLAQDAKDHAYGDLQNVNRLILQLEQSKRIATETIAAEDRANRISELEKTRPLCPMCGARSDVVRDVAPSSFGGIWSVSFVCERTGIHGKHRFRIPLDASLQGRVDGKFAKNPAKGKSKP